ATAPHAASFNEFIIVASLVARRIESPGGPQRPPRSPSSLAQHDVSHDLGDAGRAERHVAGRLDLPRARRLAQYEGGPVDDAVLEALRRDALGGQQVDAELLVDGEVPGPIAEPAPGGDLD